ncbi:MAG TPA: hypothetical protein VJV03_14370 [Pyrinomonadaceae bacterium]|nr:hypothetical protein [Pyrinomonadaceae bacterium]
MTKQTQALVLFAAAMVYALTTTAIVGNVPNSENWVLGVTVVLAVIVLAFCYRAARRAVPPDFKGGKWAATVLVLGGDPALNNLTPTQRTVGSLILLGVVLTGLVLSLVWPDRPRWVDWVQISLMLAVVSFLVLKAARKPTR